MGITCSCCADDHDGKRRRRSMDVSSNALHWNVQPIFTALPTASPPEEEDCSIVNSERLGGSVISHQPGILCPNTHSNVHLFHPNGAAMSMESDASSDLDVAFVGAPGHEQRSTEVHGIMLGTTSREVMRHRSWPQAHAGVPEEQPMPQCDTMTAVERCLSLNDSTAPSSSFASLVDSLELTASINIRQQGKANLQYNRDSMQAWDIPPSAFSPESSLC